MSNNSDSPRLETSGQPEKNPNSSTVVIDPDGDLCLTVGRRNAITFIVCPKALARASPVWKKLLYGGFAESVQPDKAGGEKWTVALPDDDPKILRVILDIIHYHFDRVPGRVGFEDENETSGKTITFSNLYKLTKWEDDLFKNGHLGSLNNADVERLAWVSWELGYKLKFQIVAKYLIKNSTTTPAGILRQGSGPRLFSDILEPGDLYNIIRMDRLAAIRDLPTETLCEDRDDACEAAMLGVIIRSLSEMDLWPIPKPGAVCTSLVTLADTLAGLDSASPLFNHDCDALQELGHVTGVGVFYPSLSKSMLEHLEAQARKTGLSNA
ncbi:uncharacterized protein F4822DRAFT_430892 [Hypoxylon trugodes]|uniref:uncharacterized protein n=1 Tax=Hypoxylon trugodes TaxID=326681 RepID=UPI0021948AF2|nr:uncharacterized protein F4822DRAFT_430892 [Hypoxylon trugodes]KAI1388136.1 hypothetical protein F4822DRAFT_430892 [Hypoxylon trugodes]